MQSESTRLPAVEVQHELTSRKITCQQVADAEARRSSAGYLELPSPKRLRQNAGSGITARRPRMMSSQQAEGLAQAASAAPMMHIPAHQLPLPMERLATDAMTADDDDHRHHEAPRLGSGSISHSDAGVSDSGDLSSGSRRLRGSGGFSGQLPGSLQPQSFQQQEQQQRAFQHHQPFAQQPPESVVAQQHDAWRADLSGGFEQPDMQQQQQHQQQLQQRVIMEQDQQLQQLHQQQQQQHQPPEQQQPQRPPPPQPPPDPLPNKADLVNMRCEIWCVL